MTTPTGYTDRVGLLLSEGGNQNVKNLDENFQRIDDRLGLNFIEDAATPAAGLLFDGAIFKERGTGRVLTARSDGAGGFTLKPDLSPKLYGSVGSYGGAGSNIDTDNKQTYMQCGTYVTTIDAAGTVTLNFPKPFPNGVLSVVANNGDTTNRPYMTIGVVFTSVNGAAYQCSVGNAPSAAGIVRINVVAIGW